MGGAQSLAFPYDIGAARSSDPRSLWTLHSGTKKADGSAVSILNFDTKKNPNRLPAARNFVRRLKVLRHPYALAFIDSVELDTNIYVVTEQVTPLDELLQALRTNTAALAWGLYQVTKVIEFMNSKELSLTHANLTTAAIFVNKAGDWKVGGFDLACDVSDPEGPLRAHSDLLPKRYKSPEYDKAQWELVKQVGPYAIDTWLLGCLYYEVFSGSLTKPEDLKQTDRIPMPLLELYQQMLNINAKNRASPSKILESKFFDIPLISSMLFLESINVKDANEKDAFFKRLEKYVEEFPPAICKYKVLPALVQALDIGSASHKAVVPVLRLGAALSQEEYLSLVLPSALKWFGAPDRAMRVTLLQNLEAILEHFPPKKVNDLFLLIENGFTDSVTGLRELTVRSMIHVAPKLDERLLNENLLKHFARLQQDPDKGIRINTTICLGRIAKFLAPATRSKVLSAAFSRPLRDPEAYARTAALAAYNECADFFTAEDSAMRVVPALAPLAYDADKAVRKGAITCLRTFTAKLERASEERPQAPTGAAAGGVATEPQTAEGGYLSWALASLPTSWAGSISTPAKKPAATISSASYSPSPSSSASASASASSSGSVSAASSATGSGAAAASASRLAAAAAATDGWEDEAWEDYNEPAKAGAGSTKAAAATDGWGDDDWDIEVRPTATARESPFEAAQARKAEKASATARKGKSNTD